MVFGAYKASRFRLSHGSGTEPGKQVRYAVRWCLAVPAKVVNATRRTVISLSTVDHVRHNNVAV